MKCPKCGYLGFETGDRCRNCGYDFSLAVRVDTPAELPLNKNGGAGDPLVDFDLTEAARDSGSGSGNDLDLDRVIGDVKIQNPPPAAPAVTPPRADETRAKPLPLFSRAPASGPAADDAPLIASPRPVLPPLSVRRATPDVVRGRNRAVRPARKDEAPLLGLESPLSDPAPSAAVESPAGSTPSEATTASAVRRVLALVVDAIILAGIDFAVIYLTLAIAGLALDQWRVLPWAPMASFLVLLNGGYLIAFIAASGQTIGKMATGIRVIRNDGLRVDFAGAALRAGGCALSVLTAGLGYLPALFAADRRALHDRIAGTRVIAGGANERLP